MASSSFYSGTGVTPDNTDVDPVAPSNITAVEDSKNAAALSEAAAAASAAASATSASSGAASASTATTKASESATSATASSTSAAASQASRVASEAAKAAAETAKTAAETARDAASVSEVASGAAEVAAETAETNAAASAAAALSSQNAAATSATTASTKAAESATSAAASEASNVASGVAKVAAETAEANAETAQTASETAKTASEAAKVAAETAETNASTSAATATTQAGIATTKAGEAATSATASASSATASEAAKDAALAALDSFDDLYLGAKASDPTVDNDGDALVSGALYFNTTDDTMKVYEGSQWVAAYASLSGAMIATNNLSDLTSASIGRANLGLGTAATTASTDYATAAQGGLAATATQPGDLSPVATSGAYGDLSGTPTLGTAASSAATDFVAVTGDSMTGNLSFGDNDKAIFGAGSDLSIYHDGANSRVQDTGTGGLRLMGSEFVALQSNDGENMVVGSNNGAVTLYYDHTPKLATSAIGVDITGIADASTLFRFGVDNSEIANNYLRFKPSGAAYIDHNTVGQVINFRLSNSSSLDTTPLVVSATGVDITGDVGADTATITGTVTAGQYDSTEALPTVRPSLLLDFANSKTLDPRITFTRGSTATYWDGKTTTRAEENKVLNGTTLTGTGWTNSNGMTITPNAGTAPDGTSTATQLTLALGKAYYQTIYSVGAATYTASVYVKQAASGSATQFRFATNNTQAWSSGGTASVTLTSSWQRVTITGTLTGGTGNMNLHMDGSQLNGNIDSNSVGNVLIWGAQVEIRGAATAFTPTSGSPIVKYQPALQTAASGEARFDHDPVTGESKGLLIEETRTNLANWSQIASNFFSGNLSDQMYDNAGIAPDGTHTADLVHESTLNEHQSIYGLIGGISGSTAYTRSCYFKSRGSRYIALMQYDGFTNHATTYDLQDGAVVSTQGSATGTIEDVGNGWFRCSQTYTTTAGASAERIQIGIPTGANAAIQQVGDGWSGVLFWGWQLEQGSFPTSYIPTSGSTVTRSTDVFNMPLSGIYSSGPVTMYYEAAEFDVADYSRLVLLSDGTNNNRMQIAVNDSLGDVQSYTVTNSNIEGLAELSYDAVPYQYYKTAAAFAAGDNAVSAAGLTPATATPTSLPQVTNMYLGSLQGADADKGGWFKKVALYPSRLSNATLQAMTEE